MKRFLGTLATVLVIVVGAALAALGALGLAVFGTSGSTSGPAAPLESDPASAAIVADLAGVEVGIPYANLLGTPTLAVSSTDGDSVFIGTGAQSAVDTFLFGVPYDLASRNGSWSTTPVPGVEQTVPDPLAQDFWLEQSVGTTADIALPTDAAPTTMVIMNADGSTGLSVELTLGFRGPHLFAYSVAAIVAGVLLIGIAAALQVRASRRRRRRGDVDAGSDADSAGSTGSGVVDVSDTSISSLFARDDDAGGPSGALTAEDR